MVKKCVASLVGAVLAMTLGAAPAMAAETPGDEIQFPVWGGDSVEAVVEGIVAEQGADRTARVLEALADSPKGPGAFPGLRRGSAGADELRAVAQAVRSGKALPRSIGDREAATAEVSAVPSTEGVTTMSLASATQLGGPISQGYAWQMSTNLQWVMCSLLTCVQRERVDIRITTNPGPTGSRVDINMNHFGDYGYLGQIAYKGYLYTGTTLKKSGSVSLNHPGTGTLWITPYTNIRGASFRYEYLLSAPTPGGTTQGNYKTGTGKCSSATTSVCKWPW